LKTGRYSSPHLKDFRERIRINGRMIPESKITDFIRKYRSAFESIQPSFFEWTAGLAFNYFREEEVDIAVIEVGMGGRLDSTNIITPLVSVITNISWDHQQFLGDTLEKIAGEKAGIMKDGIPVVIGESQPELEKFFIGRAAKSGSPVTFADRQRFPEYSSVPSSPVLYQQKNRISSYEVIRQLNAVGFLISPDEVKIGIEHIEQNTGFAGRWQVLEQNPLIICDAGHNNAGIREVVDQVNRTKHNKLHMVFGMVNDKTSDKILQLLPQNATYYFCKADIPRGLNADKLAMEAKAFNLRGKSYLSVQDALTAAKHSANPDDLIFIGGSTFVVAEVV